MMSYLSIIKNPPKICIFTGGIAPMLTNVDDVYSSLRERVKDRNLKYYDRKFGSFLEVVFFMLMLIIILFRLPW